MTKPKSQETDGANASEFITIEGVAQRHACSTETVKRAARREGWNTYRMGGRVIRYALKEVVAYEQRCANAAPSYPITPPKRRLGGA